MDVDKIPQPDRRRRLCRLTNSSGNTVGAEGGGERMLSEELPTPNATLAPLRSAQHTLPSPANRAMRGGDELADCHSE
jgi:hypothetical protein